MLITVQFPIFDARGFRTGRFDRLAKPTWPHPLPDHHFVRGFGGVIAQRVTGLTGFFSEDRLCTADNALRMPRDTKFYGHSPRVAFRHLFSDGDAVAKFEIGFRHSNRVTQLTKDHLSAMLDYQILRRYVVVGPPNEGGETILARAGRPLASLYCRATTHRPKGLKGTWGKLSRNLRIENDSLCFAGQPLITISIASPFVGAQAYGSSADFGNAFLSTWTQKVDDLPVKVIVIAEKARRISDLTRNLRIFLNRIHAELHASEYGLTAIESELRRSRTREDIFEAVRKLQSLKEIKIKGLVNRIDRAASALYARGHTQSVMSTAPSVLETIWGWRVDTVMDRYDLIREKAARLEANLQVPSFRILSRSGMKSIISVISASPLGLFICYRRDDTRDLAGRMADFLERSELRPRIFRDLGSIEPGSDWRAEIDNGMKAAHVVLPIIGSNWTGRSGSGRFRIDDQDDWVRYEVESAFTLKKKIVPVVVQGCDFPPDRLPASLQPLASIQAFILDPAAGFERSMRSLVDALQRIRDEVRR